MVQRFTKGSPRRASVDAGSAEKEFWRRTAWLPFALGSLRREGGSSPRTSSPVLRVLLPRVKLQRPGIGEGERRSGLQGGGDKKRRRRKKGEPQPSSFPFIGGSGPAGAEAGARAGAEGAPAGEALHKAGGGGGGGGGFSPRGRGRAVCVCAGRVVAVLVAGRHGARSPLRSCDCFCRGRRGRRGAGGRKEEAAVRREWWRKKRKQEHGRRGESSGDRRRGGRQRQRARRKRKPAERGGERRRGAEAKEKRKKSEEEKKMKVSPL